MVVSILYRSVRFDGMFLHGVEVLGIRGQDGRNSTIAIVLVGGLVPVRLHSLLRRLVPRKHHDMHKDIRGQATPTKYTGNLDSILPNVTASTV